LAGQLSGAFLIGFWPQAQVNDAQAAIKIIALGNERLSGMLAVLESFGKPQA
jgi:hypothetical protein